MVQPFPRAILDTYTKVYSLVFGSAGSVYRKLVVGRAYTGRRLRRPRCIGIEWNVKREVRLDAVAGVGCIDKTEPSVSRCALGARVREMHRKRERRELVYDRWWSLGKFDESIIGVYYHSRIALNDSNFVSINSTVRCARYYIAYI